jgi:hypothetical protein
MIHVPQMLKTPATRVQPLYDVFRVKEYGPVLTREERLEARRRKAAEVAHARPGFHVERLT